MNTNENSFLRSITQFQQIETLMGKNSYVALQENNKYFIKVHPQIRNDELTQKCMITCLKHPFLNQIMGITQINGEYGIITRYFELDLAQKRLKLTEQQKVNILFQISSVLEYCHQRDVIHGNLVAKKIFLRQYQKDNYVPFVGGFHVLYSNITEGSTLSSDDFTHSKAKDVFAFGILICELFGFDELNLQNPMLKLNEKSIFRPLKALVDKCKRNDPNERPSFSEIHANLKCISENIDFRVQKIQMVKQVQFMKDEEALQPNSKKFNRNPVFQICFPQICGITTDYSSDGRYFAVANSFDQQIQIYNNEREIIFESKIFDLNGVCMQFSTNNELFAVANLDSILIFKTKSWEICTFIQNIKLKDITSISFDNNLLGVSTDYGYVCVFSFEDQTCNCLCEFLPQDYSFIPIIQIRPHSTKYFACVRYDGISPLFNIIECKQEHVWFSEIPFTAGCFSSNGNFWICGDCCGDLKIIDLNTKKMTERYHVINEAIMGIIVSQDNSMIYCHSARSVFVINWKKKIKIHTNYLPFNISGMSLNHDNSKISLSGSNAKGSEILEFCLHDF
eukprot:TRINITY_DN7142_c0_g1_i1.p1 TRINITY_DN7142_c0_g1~~TRINITY_DN7142_c0_g1_i1.p1  ORF type:complete len:565 (+),score=91.80 TRINITY_DN7142_c0_g1_i1:328-2022(+)